jgi:hypothetical protein
MFKQAIPWGIVFKNSPKELSNHIFNSTIWGISGLIMGLIFIVFALYKKNPGRPKATILGLLLGILIFLIGLRNIFEWIAVWHNYIRIIESVKFLGSLMWVICLLYSPVMLLEAYKTIWAKTKIKEEFDTLKDEFDTLKDDKSTSC